MWSTRHAALFDTAKGVNHLAVVGGHSLDMSQYAVGDFTEISAALATRIDRDHHGGDQRADRGDLAGPDRAGRPVGVGRRGSRCTGGLAGPGLAGRLPGGTRPTLTHAPADGSPARQLTVPAAHRPLLGTPSPVSHAAQVYTDPARAIRRGDDFGPDFTTAVRVHRLLDTAKSSARSGSRVRLG
ncbi:hypothetical protein ABZ960_21955 [Streptomyces pseudovenezuelae]|uniref:hypothetical protein n=1 Tax=Streptomyces pseudovenezuelae TaxID=67350 RepID=UPI0034A4DF09